MATKNMNFGNVNGDAVMINLQNGGMTFNGSSLPQFADAPPYLLGIEAFAHGGQVKWKAIGDITVGHANTATTASKLASNAGSTTQPIYFANGVPVSTSYYLGASINAGTANRAAYYSGANAVSSASSIYMTGTNLGVNVTSMTSPKLIAGADNTQTTLSTVFNVSGGSYFNGTMVLASNKRAIEFRSDHASYNSYIFYGTAGNEALNFVNKQAITSFIFWTGNRVEGSSNWYLQDDGTTARTDNPAIQIKQNSLYINKLLPHGINAEYKLYVNGTSYFNGNTTHNGIDYFANGTSYYINNSADAKLRYLALGGLDPTSSYQLYVNGTSWIKGTLWTRHLYPEANNTYDLGSNNYKWRNLYLSSGMKSNTRFYPLVGNSYGSQWYKVTLPYPSSGYTGSNWMMISMDITVGGPYSNGPSGKIELAYFFTYGYNTSTSTGSWSTSNVYGSAIGSRMNQTNIEIRYRLTEPNIMYIKAGPDQYRGISIQNLHVHDSAPGYDWLTTKIETSAAPDTSVYTSTVPLSFYSTNNGTTARIENDVMIPAGKGFYWDPYVESASDASDAAGIWQIKSGVAGGTELRMSQQNDATDVINLCAPAYIYLNSKRAFTISTSWLGINENSAFSSGIYTGSSLIRSDSQIQVGSGGANFYANNSGNGYFSNTLGIAGTNTGYKLYVNGTGYFNGDVYSKDANSTGSRRFESSNTNGTVALLASTNRGVYDTTNSRWIIYTTTNGSAVYVPKWASIGSTTLPVYFDSNGMPQTITSYQGNAATATGLSAVIANDKLPDRLREYHTSAMTLDTTVNGWYYATSGGPFEYLHPSGKDYMVMSQGYSAAWGSQIATDFRSNRIAVRNKNNGTWSDWTRLLDQNIGSPRAHFGTTSGAANYVLITIDKYTSWMLNFTLKLYQDYQATDIQISGYNYGSNHWYSPKAVILGSTSTSAIKVYFGWTDSSKLWVAVDGGAYTGADVINIVNGYTQISLDDAFTVSRVSTLPGTLQDTKTIYRPWYRGDSVTGAVWNDYAEYRESDTSDFGYVLTENGDDTLSKTTERLQHFAGVSSDTWGFSQGETEKAKTPIAVAGRVLVYTYQDRNNYKPGDCVCAAPNGTVDIMTREEVRDWPDRIVGTVSCIPDYKEWGGGDRPAVKVNNRIWIKVK